MFIAAPLAVNGRPRHRVWAQVKVVLHAVVIVVQFGLGTAVGVYGLTKRRVRAHGIELVFQTVTVVIVQINDAATYPVGAVEHAGNIRAQIPFKADRVVAESIAVSVF